MIWVLPLRKHSLSRASRPELLRRHRPCPMGPPALLGCNTLFSYASGLGMICFRRLPCKQAGFRSCFLSKTSAIQAVGRGSIAKGGPFYFSRLVDTIDGRWDMFSQQRGSWRNQNHLKCPQTPLCGQLKPETYLFPIQAAEPTLLLSYVYRRHLGHQLDGSICSADCAG